MVESSNGWVSRTGYKNAEQGFGRKWRRAYRVALPGVQASPEEVIRVWKAEFPSFWKPGSYIADLARISEPGETAEIHLAGPLGLKFITGFLVARSDDDCFQLMTRDDHFFSGIISFTASDEDGAIVAQTEASVRPSDPIWETMFRLGVLPQEEDKFWIYTLERLAQRFGVYGKVTVSAECLDQRMLWRNYPRIFNNLGAKTMLKLAGKPSEQLARRLPVLKNKPPEQQRRAGMAITAALIGIVAVGILLKARRQQQRSSRKG